MSKFAVGFNVCVQCVLHQCHQLMKIYTPHLISLKQVWIWCSSFSNCRKGVNNKHRSLFPSISIMDGNRCHADALLKENRCIKLICITLELGSFFSVAHSTAHNQLGYRKIRACQVLETLTGNQKACRGIRCVFCCHASHNLGRLCCVGTRSVTQLNILYREKRNAYWIFVEKPEGK